MTKPLQKVPTRVLLCALVALFFLQAGVASADPAEFWTKERMREAVPAEVQVERPPSGGGAATRLAPTEFLAGVVRDLVPDPTVEGTRAHGKIFFTTKQKGEEQKMYVCSGTVVTSKIQSVVLTAGHCVYDAQGTRKFMDNWVFVPAYGKDIRPFGIWPAKELATTKEWRLESNIRYDIGAAIVSRNADGKRLQEVVGSRGIAFSQTRNLQYSAFGYPHTDPEGGEFDGTKQYVCKSGMTRRDAPVGGFGPRTTQIRCDMSSGASGGGWVVGRTVHSVTSYSYDADRIHLYGPYFGTTAKDLYMAVRAGINKKSRKKVSVAPARGKR